ncbi:MAG: ABC transporter permease [Burkholderiaceae bacterium]
MQVLAESFSTALALVFSADPDLLEIVGLSLRVSLTAVVLACLLGLPVGALIAACRFRGRNLVIVLMNALMGLPPVVVGLLVYLHLSNSGPLGWMQLLYTPSAMVIAQTILITPLVAALSRQVLQELHSEYDEQFRSMSIPLVRQLQALSWDGRYGLLTVGLAGFGRSISEVGAVIIVGGNIAHLTRVMTTAIALETSKGDLALAMALGIILLSLSLLINGLAMGLRSMTQRVAYA